jgi:hypothetical protein
MSARWTSFRGLPRGAAVGALLLLIHAACWAANPHSNPRSNLRVTMAGTGTGMVTSPAGIHCASSCFAPFERGTKVTLTAVADSGSTFAGWSGGLCSGTGDCAVYLFTDDIEVVATFNASGGTSGGRPGDRTGPAPGTCTLTVTNVQRGGGAGLVTSTPAGIDCGSTCSSDFPAGTAITLRAEATAGQFLGWSGGCSDRSPTCGFTLNANTSVTASFGPLGLTLLTTALPNAQVGVEYRVPISVSGGAGRLGYRVVSGSLPPGLRIVRTAAGTAVIAGTPRRAGDRTFTLRVVDAKGTMASQPLSITVEARR